MKSAARAWRESASLIVLARDSGISTSTIDHHNYKVLTFKRPAKSSFMPNSMVFPGGVAETADESLAWLKHFQNCGVSEKQLTELSSVGGPRPSIFQRIGLSALKKEISLRITAIRETFEELGVLICRRKGELNVNDDEFGGFVEEFNRAKWQRIVHDDPKQFLALCEKHELVPDIWRLYEWSAWLTPAKIPKRFETAFFLVSLQTEPKLICEKNEVDEANWETPTNLLASFHSETIDLAMPQAYELTRIAKYKNIDALTKFAKMRNNLGTNLHYPFVYICAEGILYVFPGDYLYPKNPDLNLVDYDAQCYANQTFLDLRKRAVKMHRCEQRTVYDSQFILNFELPNGHVGPMSKL